MRPPAAIHSIAMASPRVGSRPDPNPVSREAEWLRDEEHPGDIFYGGYASVLVHQRRRCSNTKGEQELGQMEKGCEEDEEASGESWHYNTVESV